MNARHGVNRAFCFLTLLLLLGMMGLEVPELLSLTDDTSNDPEISECVRGNASQTSPEISAVPDEAVRYFALPGSCLPPLFGSYFSPPQKSAQDILHLIALQRE
jgi:hypothetical protein